MKNIFTVLILTILFSASAFSQSSNATKLPYMNQVKEGDSRVLNFTFYNGIVPVPFWSEFVPSNAVPGLIGFQDYTTNGNTLNQVIRSGDTLIVAFNYVDSAEARTANAGTTVRMAYNYSLDGGVTWQSTTRVDLTLIKSRWPDFALVTAGGLRTVAGSGRVWTGALRAGGVGIDPAFGAGSAGVYYIPGTGQATNTDYFTDVMTNGKMAGLWESNDTIYSQTFDPTLGTPSYGPKVMVYRTVSSNFVASYDVYASKNSNTIYSFYNFTNENPGTGGSILYPIFRYQKSTDNGITWTAPTGVFTNYTIENDSCHAYWHQDVAYKPGTDNPYLVFSTRPNIAYGNFNPGGQLMDSSRRAYNILIWSPVLNGGTPVRVASYHNVDVLSDTNKFKQVTRLRTIQGVLTFAYQVNGNIVGHPTIGFSSDGSVIHVAFDVTQTDTSTEGFNYFDIFSTKSTDGGLTWVTPVNVTSTPTQDEMYPSISKTGNTVLAANLTYQSTAVPGCQGFGNSGTIESQIIAPVYQCVNPAGPIGIINLGTEVPKKFSVQQNFPNPFNPTTKIRFALPKSANVTITVYNITGQVVSVLANNEFATAGNKEVTFDGSNIASGVYFYSVRAGDFVETKKMVLVK